MCFLHSIYEIRRMTFVSLEKINKINLRRSETGSVITLSPFIVGLEALRSLFSAINCVVVAHEIKAEHTLGTIFNLRSVARKTHQKLSKNIDI